MEIPVSNKQEQTSLGRSLGAIFACYAQRLNAIQRALFNLLQLGSEIGHGRKPFRKKPTQN